MRNLFSLSTLCWYVILFGGFLCLPTGCDEIKGPCEVEDTKTGTPGCVAENLESWRIEDGWGILKFSWPKDIILFVCTSRTLDYQLTIQKRSGITFTVLPQARLIWKYPAPKPSKAVLEGKDTFETLFEFNPEETTLDKVRISLAYSDEAFGGYFIPGVEVKFPTTGNQSDDYKYFWDHFILYVSYKVDYRMTF